MAKSFEKSDRKAQSESTSANMRNTSRKLMQRDTGGDNRFHTRVKPAMKPHQKDKYKTWQRGDYGSDD